MKSVTMATKIEMSDYTVLFSVLGHKKFIHKFLAKSESVRFQPLFKIFWCSQRIALKVYTKFPPTTPNGKDTGAAGGSIYEYRNLTHFCLIDSFITKPTI